MAIKARNWNAVSAHFRQAGAMKHKNTPRGGARNSMAEWLDEAEAEMDMVPWLCGCGNGMLACPVEEVPDFCDLCGAAVKGE